MSKIKELENYVKDVLLSLNYEIDNVVFEDCSIPLLGQFQLNFAMGLAKKYGKNPRDIASEVVSKLDSRFTSINVAGPGFINFKLSDEFLISYANEYIESFEKNIDYEEKKTIIVDYGGANAAKALHVGHMRSANIGEANKRLIKLFGHHVISDVHLGDLGRQAGMLISELMVEQPNLPFFNKDYKGPYPKINLTKDDLGRMYPKASMAAKSSEERMEQVREITAEIDRGNASYTELWRQIVDISKPLIKEVYDKLNCTFDLWNGELSSMQYVDDTMKIMKNYLYESEGALVIDVKEESDKTEIPPLIVIKSNGTTVYGTRDLATLYERVKEYNPSEIWYFTDQRQALYFEQVFRASYKTGLVNSSTKLKHFGFGTINGADGKPYKTRDGGVMELSSLISLLRAEVLKKVKEENNNEETVEKITIATLKYSDLLPFREIDYIFDPIKFASLEGKTGPYILYSIVRIKSVLKKTDISNAKFKNIFNDDIRNILVLLLKLPKILTRSYKDAAPSYIADYVYDLASLFNKFYGSTNIINEKEEINKETSVALLKFVYSILHNLLYILAIDEVEKM